MITPDNSERELLKLLGTAINTETGVSIVLGVENRVPFPSGDAVAMTTIMQERQSTNETYYPDRPDPAINEADRVDLLFSTLVVQLDCYGPNAHATANTLLMILRSDLFLQHGLSPLFCTEPRNITFSNAENQQAARWSLDANIQFNTVWLQAQDSALTIDLTTILNTDTTLEG